MVIVFLFLAAAAAVAVAVAVAAVAALFVCRPHTVVLTQRHLRRVIGGIYMYTHTWNNDCLIWQPFFHWFTRSSTCLSFGAAPIYKG